MPGLPVFSFPQCEYRCHAAACRELFHAISHFDSIFNEAHQTSNMICKGWLLKSRIKTSLFLEEIISSSKVGLKDFESDMVVRITKLGNSTRKTTEINNTVLQTAGSQILTAQLQGKNQICKTLYASLWSCKQGQVVKTDRVKLDLETAQCSLFLCSILSLHHNCWRSVGA